MRLAWVTVVALALLLALEAPSASGAVTVTVRLTDRGAVLSGRTFAQGTVRFVVTNASRHPRRFVVANKRTPLLQRGHRHTLTVMFTRSGAHVFVVAAKTRQLQRGLLQIAAPPPPSRPTVTAVEIGSFEMPTDIDAPPGSEDTVVVAEQGGLVHLVVEGERQPEPFLDLRDRVLAHGEAGLLSIAFPLDYERSGLVYAFFNDRGGNINIVELRRSSDGRIDASDPRTLLHAVKPAANHNGGKLQVAADGRLYAAVGDGGVAAGLTPGGLVQDPETVWGKILRFDVESGSYETWASGLRNPWRFWIDPLSGDAYIADVGESRREEVNLVPNGASGLNFGWPCFEGTLVFDSAAACASAAPPLYEYGHGPEACSITGGVVARDPRLPHLEGAYLFADLCGSTVRALRRTASGIAVEDVVGGVAQAISFGVDGLQRIYVGSATGTVYRLDPAS